MPSQERALSSVLKRLLDRIGNPLEWSFADKALLFIGFALLMNIPFTLALHVSFRVPGLTPEFFNRSLHLLGIYCQWGFVLLFAVLFVIGWKLRRTDPENRWLVYGLAIVSSVHEAWFMAAIGHSTNLATFLTLFVVALVGLMFFDLCFAFIVIGVWVLVMGGGSGCGAGRPDPLCSRAGPFSPKRSKGVGPSEHTEKIGLWLFLRRYF